MTQKLSIYAAFGCVFFFRSILLKIIGVASIFSADREKINEENDKVRYFLDLIFIDEGNTLNCRLEFWEG